jgi:hypothetical protein
MQTRVQYEYVPLNPATAAIEALRDASANALKRMEAEHPQVVLDAFDSGLIKRSDIQRLMRVQYAEILRLAVSEHLKRREDPTHEDMTYVTTAAKILSERDELAPLLRIEILTPEEVVGRD